MYKTSDAQCNCSVFVDWCPASPWASATHPWPTSHSFIVQCDPIQHGKSHWPLGVTFPGYAPSQSLVHPQPPGWQDRIRRWRVLDFVKALLLINNQNTIMLILNPKSSTIPATRRKINSIQANPGHFVSVLYHEHHVVKDFFVVIKLTSCWQLHSFAGNRQPCLSLATTAGPVAYWA